MQRNCKQADISISASGDNTIVAATSGKKVRVWQLWLVGVSGDNSVKFGDGTSSPSYFNATAFPLVQNGAITFQATDEPWFTTTVGNGFSINLANAFTAAGRIYYTVE